MDFMARNSKAQWISQSFMHMSQKPILGSASCSSSSSPKRSKEGLRSRVLGSMVGELEVVVVEVEVVVEVAWEFEDELEMWFSSRHDGQWGWGFLIPMVHWVFGAVCGGETTTPFVERRGWGREA